MDSIEPGKIFVGGLSWETDKDRLRSHFEKYGTITDSVIMTDPVTKNPRGFGFVTFENAESVHAACNSGPHTLDDKKIDPKPAQAKLSPGGQGMPITVGATGGGTSSAPVLKVFIGGVAQETTEDDIKAYFHQWLSAQPDSAGRLGTVTEVDLKYDRDNERMRGFGFVGFDTAEVVDKVVQAHYHQINGKTVEVKKAEPRQQGGGGGGGGYGRGGGAAGGYQQQQYGNGYGRGSASSQFAYAYGGQQQQYPAAGQYGQYSYPGYTSTGTGYGNYALYGQQQQDQRGTDYSSTAQAQMTSYGQDSSTYPSATRSSYPATATEGYPQQNVSYGGYESPYNQTASYENQGATSYGRGGGAAQRQNYHPYSR